MIRILAAAAAAAGALATVAFAGAATAQTWGQPVYLDAWGRPVGGSPLSGVETRSHVATGRWAGGYSDRPQVYVPAPGHVRDDRRAYRSGRDGGGYDRGYGGYGNGRYDSPSRPGYRDEWGYNDDRPPSAQGWSGDRRSRRHDRDCGCGDVYLYDR